MNRRRKCTSGVVLGVAAAVIVAYVAGCGLGKDLNRGRAAELIRSHASFIAPRYETIFIGADFRNSDFIGFGNWNVVDALIGLGYLEERDAQIRLTPSGQAACKDSPRDAQRPEARAFGVATRELEEVTGITDVPFVPGGTVKQVSFTWKWILTPLGHDLSKKSTRIAARYSAEETRSGTAICRLYDDGWRLEELSGDGAFE